MTRSKMSLQQQQAAGSGKSVEKTYLLYLYIAGLSPRSQRAIDNVRKICEERLRGRYELVIRDIYQEPVLAKQEQILAVPTLIKKLPPPLRKFVGDMSNTEKLLVGLDLKVKQEKPR